MGSLPMHKFTKYTTTGEDYKKLPLNKEGNRFGYMLGVDIDDYIALVVPKLQDQLDHMATAIFKGIHDIFPEDAKDSEDPISLKKLLEDEGMWAITKDILGFNFNGLDKTIWLDDKKRDALLTILHGWLRSAWDHSAGIPYVEFRSVTVKLQHAFISIPAGKRLLLHMHVILRKGPPFVFLH